MVVVVKLNTVYFLLFTSDSAIHIQMSIAISFTKHISTATTSIIHINLRINKNKIKIFLEYCSVFYIYIINSYSFFNTYFRYRIR